MADFKTAFDITNGNEGGYSNDPNDHGGETYAGITRKNFPNWKGWTIVDSHKPIHAGSIINDISLKELTQEFYRRNFWEPLKGDEIQNQELANQVYDFAVNAGVPQALKLLSQS